MPKKYDLVADRAEINRLLINEIADFVYYQDCGIVIVKLNFFDYILVCDIKKWFKKHFPNIILTSMLKVDEMVILNFEELPAPIEGYCPHADPQMMMMALRESAPAREADKMVSTDIPIAQMKAKELDYLDRRLRTDFFPSFLLKLLAEESLKESPSQIIFKLRVQTATYNNALVGLAEFRELPAFKGAFEVCQKYGYGLSVEAMEIPCPNEELSEREFHLFLSRRKL